MCKCGQPGCRCSHMMCPKETPMKKSRGGRMTAAKKRAAKAKGGKGAVAKRASGRNIMKT